MKTIWTIKRSLDRLIHNHLMTPTVFMVAIECFILLIANKHASDLCNFNYTISEYDWLLRKNRAGNGWVGSAIYGLGLSLENVP